jgi:hypothetical protein
MPSIATYPLIKALHFYNPHSRAILLNFKALYEMKL